MHLVPVPVQSIEVPASRAPRKRRDARREQKNGAVPRRLDGREWTVLADHVAPFRLETGYVSTFNAAVLEARLATGRDPRSGKLGAHDTATLWSGTVIYLVLLEQIGKSLRPAGGREFKRPEHALEKALRQFGPRTVTLPQRRVLYALRCAFAHEFGLFNRGNRAGQYRRVFRLDDSRTGPLIRWPGRPWNGRYQDAGPECSTTVNLVRVCDLVENVVRSVRVHSNSVALRSELPVEELQRRFGFHIVP